MIAVAAVFQASTFRVADLQIENALEMAFDRQIAIDVRVVDEIKCGGIQLFRRKNRVVVENAVRTGEENETEKAKRGQRIGCWKWYRCRKWGRASCALTGCGRMASCLDPSKYAR